MCACCVGPSLLTVMFSSRNVWSTHLGFIFCGSHHSHFFPRGQCCGCTSPCGSPSLFFVFVGFFFFFFFLERGREEEREEEKHECVVASHTPPTGALACNPGICSDWESNHNPLLLSVALNPLNHTSWGLWFLL